MSEALLAMEKGFYIILVLFNFFPFNYVVPGYLLICSNTKDHSLNPFSVI